MTRDEREWAGRTQVPFDMLEDTLDAPTAAWPWEDFNDPLQAGNFSKYPGGIIVNKNARVREPVGRVDRAELARLRFVQKFTDNLFLYDRLAATRRAGTTTRPAPAA